LFRRSSRSFFQGPPGASFGSSRPFGGCPSSPFFFRAEFLMVFSPPSFPCAGGLLCAFFRRTCRVVGFGFFLRLSSQVRFCLWDECGACVSSNRSWPLRFPPDSLFFFPRAPLDALEVILSRLCQVWISWACIWRSSDFLVSCFLIRSNG